jgi:hypothetical protein
MGHDFELERIAFCIAAEGFAVAVGLFCCLIIGVRNQARNERDDRRGAAEGRSPDDWGRLK